MCTEFWFEMLDDLFSKEKNRRNLSENEILLDDERLFDRDEHCWRNMRRFHRCKNNAICSNQPEDFEMKMILNRWERLTGTSMLINRSIFTGPAKTYSIGCKSLAYRHIGPVDSKYFWWKSLCGGYWPSLGTISIFIQSKFIKKDPTSRSIPGVVLWPKIPFINEGNRILPPISAPTAKGTPAAETMQPAPPELPPTIRDKSYGLFVVP